ncbi:MAG: glycosyltransferase [Elusimicrobiales bacterium]|nr:glycosyltransferase [Elusimicrobiales bacterium]
MKILINASNLSAGGGIQVADSLINALKKRKENQYAVAVSPAVKKALPPLNSFPDNFVFSDKTDRNYSPVRVLSGHCGSLDDFLKETGSEIVFTIFGPAYWTPRSVPHLCGYALPFYIYPDSPALADIGIINRVKFYFHRFLRMRAFSINGTAFVTETEDVSSRLKKMLPEHRVYTVSNAYNQIFDNHAAQEELKLPPFDGITLLTVSAAYRHKNLGLIIRTAEWLKKNSPDFRFRFVLTVEPEKLGFARKNVPPELFLTGSVNVAACPSLYRQSDFMFLPTMLECFSASYPEAFRMGKPVLTSDLPFARGLCGDAAEYFNPLSAEEAGRLILRVSADETRKKELAEKGRRRLALFLSAEQRTDKYLEILEHELRIFKKK